VDRGPAMRWRATVSTVIRLVPVTMDLIDAAITGDDALALALGYDVTRGWLNLPGSPPSDTERPYRITGRLAVGRALVRLG
jgi:hypothetical protein